MSGRIKILGTRLNDRVRHPKQNTATCLCSTCKHPGTSHRKYHPKGKTYQQQILESLKSVDFWMEYEGDYVVFAW